MGGSAPLDSVGGSAPQTPRAEGSSMGAPPTRKAMRRFVVIGRRATASPDFSLSNLPASSGRLDVLVRCLRAALLVSHGLRRDTVAYLVLLGTPEAPRAIRVDGPTARFLRPDERSLAVIVQKALGQPLEGAGFTALRNGIAVASGGLDAVLADLGPGAPYLLEEGAPDVREVALDAPDPVFFLGDHLGFDEATRAVLARLGATPVGLGPVSVHAEDAIVLVANELDRRDARGRG
jgi:tRNA (pseudouridine54-N1)-methyltransferase